MAAMYSAFSARTRSALPVQEATWLASLLLPPTPFSSSCSLLNTSTRTCSTPFNLAINDCAYTTYNMLSSVLNMKSTPDEFLEFGGRGQRAIAAWEGADGRI